MNNYKKKLFINFAILVVFVLYFYLLNHLFFYLGRVKFTEIYKYISISIVFLTTIIFEIAYKKESGIITIYGLEVFLLSVNTIISITMISKLNITFENYINISCLCYLIYYIFKFIINYTINKREYLKSLSDIKDIVNTDPLKKEAHKRNN